MHIKKDYQRTNKKIALVSRRPCFPLGMGGAEMSSYLLMIRLLKLGFNIKIVGELLPGNQFVFINEVSKLYPNYSIEYNNHGFILHATKDFSFALATTSGFYDFATDLLSNYVPDYIFTQLEGCLEMSTFAQKHNIKCIHFLRDSSNPYNFDILKAQWLNTQEIKFVSNSYYIKKYFIQKHNINSVVSYPLPMHCSCNSHLTNQDKRNLRLLFINPHQSKGIDIVLKLSEYFNESVEFHIVEGWNKQDLLYLKDKANLITYNKQTSLCDIYSKCDILLIPSQSHEAFSRVAVEGLHHGLTVIASEHSGLIESVGEGGMLVENYREIKEWVKKIDLILQNRNILKEYAGKAKNQLKNIYMNDPIDVVVKLMKSEQ